MATGGFAAGEIDVAAALQPREGDRRNFRRRREIDVQCRRCSRARGSQLLSWSFVGGQPIRRRWRFEGLRADAVNIYGPTVAIFFIILLLLSRAFRRPSLPRLV